MTRQKFYYTIRFYYWLYESRGDNYDEKQIEDFQETIRIRSAQTFEIDNRLFLDLHKCYPIIEDIDKEPEKKEKKKGKGKAGKKGIDKESHGSTAMVTEVPDQAETKCQKGSESGGLDSQKQIGGDDDDEAAEGDHDSTKGEKTVTNKKGKI